MSEESISVIVVTYGEPIEMVERCVRSLEIQENINLEIILLDQIGNANLQDTYNKLNRGISHTFKYLKIPAKSLSFARNYGMEIASNNHIAFIDPDAVAEKKWASNIIKEFKKDKSVGIIGGKIIPKFSGELHWYHKSRYVWDIYSVLDLGSEPKYVKKVVGANFAINRELTKDERFREDLGRREGKLFGGEETDFCERAARKGIKIKYVPNAIVYHYISNERLKLSWILKRFYYGGISRGLRGGKPEPGKARYSIRDCILLPIFIIPYIFGLIRGKLMNR